VRRREFIVSLGGAAAWPVIARAQKAKRMRRIGALMPFAATDGQAQARNAAFLQGLQQLGWIVGHNVQIDYRWSTQGSADETCKGAAELVALTPDVILTSGTAAVAPLLHATREIPIVFVNVGDPVGAPPESASGAQSRLWLLQWEWR
jgi:putative tryptophan/tyrosine transport system substrate-binding protein